MTECGIVENLHEWQRDLLYWKRRLKEAKDQRERNGIMIRIREIRGYIKALGDQV